MYLLPASSNNTSEGENPAVVTVEALQQLDKQARSSQPFKSQREIRDPDAAEELCQVLLHVKARLVQGVHDPKKAVSNSSPADAAQGAVGSPAINPARKLLDQKAAANTPGTRKDCQRPVAAGRFGQPDDPS